MAGHRHERPARLAFAIACSLAWLAPWGCVPGPRGPSGVVVERGPGRGGGPPPHAPAHGYRRKFRQDGVQLVFDSGLDVYVVVDLSDVFFRDGRYFRLAGGSWSVSASPHGGWSQLNPSELPNGLRGYTGRSDKGKARGKSGR